MEHPMPVGKTFPTNPSIPQKEARSFSIKDEKTPIILSPDEMPPAGKADYDSAQNNQDKENRQSDRPTGNVRHQTFFPHSRKPEQKEKVFLSSPEKNKTVVCENTPEENGRRFSLTGRPKAADKTPHPQSDRPTGNVRHQTFFPHSRKPKRKEKIFFSSPGKNRTVVCENTPVKNGRRFSLTGRPKAADKTPQTPKRSVALNSRANRSVSSLSAAYTDNSTDADIKQTVTSRNQDQNDAAKPHTGLMNDDGDGLPTKEFTREKPMIMLATVIVQLLFVCGWGFFYYFLYRIYTVIIIPGQTYQGNIYAYTIFAAESRIKPRIVALAGSALCAVIAFLLFAAIYELPILNDSSYNAFWASE